MKLLRVKFELHGFTNVECKIISDEYARYVESLFKETYENFSEFELYYSDFEYAYFEIPSDLKDLDFVIVDIPVEVANVVSE